MTGSKNKKETQIKPTPSEETTLIIKHKEKEKMPKEENLPELKGLNMKDFVVDPLRQKVITKKEILRIPCKVPSRQRFFRIHPEKHTFIYLIKWEEDGEYYLIHPNVLPLLETSARYFKVYLGMYRSGNIFLFPVQQEDSSGRWNSWHESQDKTVQKAKDNWLRMDAERDIGGYNIINAEGDIPEPQWPEKTMDEFLKIAFSGTVIVDTEHPVIKSLKGK